MNDENLSKWMEESWKRWVVFYETWKVKLKNISRTNPWKLIYFKDFSRTTYNSMNSRNSRTADHPALSPT